ncbi:ABC transporter substrate-binding protein [Microbacterium sp. LWO12-1.2]|uniref:ABC transporter substrate-binding protein n=1 Tax=Microbacterium sp. LWO12-1.2 TaxID=3135261 RepID=UPI00344944C1
MRSPALSRIIAGAAAVVVATAMLASCSSPESSTTTKDLRFQLFQAPTSFDPFHAEGAADGEIVGLHFRSLIANESQEFVPSLASSWEFTPDATSVTFTLAETNWSDGEPFTADDVVYSLETWADPATESLHGGELAGVVGYEEFVAGSAPSVSGIKALDETTVQIDLTEPSVVFLSNLLYLKIIPEHIYGEIDSADFAGNEEFRSPSVGIGPYIFSRWVDDDQIEFVPNPESLEDHPLDHIYAQYLTGDVARAQLQTGEIDIAQLASADVETVRQEDVVDVQVGPGIGAMALYSALDNGKLADARVRQAILYAIDRQAIVDNVLNGNGRVPQSMLYTPEWATPDDLIEFDYDPEKAKELLADAAWDASTVVYLDIIPGQPDRDAVMNVVQGQLAAVGIDAQLRASQPAQLTELVENREFDLLISIMGLVGSEPGNINRRFMCDASSNISGYCNPELDALLLQGVKTDDQSVREPIYQEANRILNADQPAMPLYVEQPAYGSAKRVTGFDPAVGTLNAAQHWNIAD